MRKIVATEFITLDGVIAEPHKWSFPYWNDEISKFKHEELFASDAHLLGKVTYQEFAAAWPSRKDDTGFADAMNHYPKYVVSTTLEKAEWNNSTILKTNVAEEIRKLKEQTGKNILVAGSVTLVHTLMAQNLIDKYHLLVYPIVQGSGKRLFKDESKTKLKLVDSKTTSTGVVMLTYQPDTN
jgi:dihydrofolate reductase